ncbi:TRL domain-containing protein [Marinobacter zhejiangensis]|uniref:TRL-like protein family protein n=1 Tax=Marinobacter zhejiangensis TaxID=488535 RepID=A0A1I4T321_9GAMM|nr:TRL domain-containing protein [Marinobacter zhejiangensis]SFM71112.1 TRL-like protein family protein [Marinobacter zhejiangensis]
MKIWILLLSIVSMAGCATSTRDLAKTLRYADGARVGVANIDFEQLQARPRGEACTWNVLFFIPLVGDGSLITAADNGDIDNIKLTGETGVWYFPFNKNCTVVFGDPVEA